MTDIRLQSAGNAWDIPDLGGHAMECRQVPASKTEVNKT